MGWKNPRPNDLSPDGLRATLQSLERFLKDPVFENGISLGTGAAPSYSTGTGATTPAPTRLFTDGTWVAPTLLNSWVNYGAPFQTARYTKINGVVYVEGLVKNGTVGANIFALPAGFRPAARLLLSVDTSSGLGRIDVDVDGTFLAQAGGNIHFSITLAFVAGA